MNPLVLGSNPSRPTNPSREAAPNYRAVAVRRQNHVKSPPPVCSICYIPAAFSASSLVDRENSNNDPPVPAAASSPSATATSPDVVAHSARAHAVLDAATTRLAWTDDDSVEFRHLLSALPPADREALMAKFAHAVNERGMRLETLGPPF